MPIQWNESLSVKVKDIDQQHRKLIALIAGLEEAMSRGRGKDVLGQVFTELVQYTRDHFAFEERLMAAHRYPDEASHRQKHEALTRQVWELSVKFKAGEAALTIPTMSFLSKWLTDHILNVDAKLGVYLKTKGIE